MVMRRVAEEPPGSAGVGKVKAEKKAPLTLRLAFGELEAFTGSLLTVLLSLMCARVAREKTELLELTAQFGIELEQCAGNAMARRPGLTANSAAVGEDQDIETIGQLYGEQGLLDIGAGGFIDKIMFEGPIVDSDLTLARTQKNAGGGGLTATGG